ncbi:cilia- and flagella-associated protein 45-like, partial [Alligator sinensis]|uniref:Cilia- and flagella-associated protein 45 n=1 Tax=Alligator sinensis TaxID=38654 RepID=A0A1U7SDE2_ALLSI
MALPSPASPAKQPVVPSVPEPQPAQGPSKTTLVLPQLHEAGAPRGKVLPPPPPGQPNAKGKVAWVRAPMQPLPQLGYNTRTMPVLKPKTKNLQQSRPAYLATMPHGAHDLSPPVDQPYKPKTTLIVTKDYVRELVLPRERPPQQTLILSRAEYERIKAQCVIEDRQAKAAAYKAERDATMAAVAQRKKAMKERILLKQKVQKSDLEKEAEERGNYLLQRAYRMRLEQEDEIKDMEKMIVDARCHAVLDAQMIEKQQMEKELKQEELRLDQNMEVKRQKVVRMQEELEEKRKQELIRGRCQIEKQIEEKEKERAIQAELQDLEAQQIRDCLQQLHLEELR